MRVAVLAVAGVCLTLAGCTKTVEEMNYSERQALDQQIAKRCVEQGVKPGSAEMGKCTEIEMQSEVAQRRRQAAIEDADAASATVCTPIGNSIFCS